MIKLSGQNNPIGDQLLYDVARRCAFVKSKTNFVIGDEEGWQLWDTIDTNRTKATVQGLQKGKEYQFRIIAINKAGKSDPSHSSRGKEALPRSRKNNNITAVCLYIFKLQVVFYLFTYFLFTFFQYHHCWMVKTYTT